MSPEQFQQYIDIVKTESAPYVEQLGKTAEWTFELFVKQVYVNAFTSLLLIIPSLFIFGLSCWLLKRRTKITSGDETGNFFLFIACMSLFALSFQLMWDGITPLIQAYINPEYAAIQLMFETVKNGK